MQKVLGQEHTKEYLVTEWESRQQREATSDKVTLTLCDSPRMLATASNSPTWLVSAPALRLSASTIEASTGCGCCKKWSIVARHEVIRCGKVPPTTVSLSPIVSSTKPTSPIAPH